MKTIGYYHRLADWMKHFCSYRRFTAMGTYRRARCDRLSKSAATVPRQHGDDPLAADDRVHGHHDRVIVHDRADDGGVPAQRMETHRVEQANGIRGKHAAGSCGT